MPTTHGCLTCITTSIIPLPCVTSFCVMQAMIRSASFLRALAYYHALDLFRNIPFVTENDPVGSFIPPRYTGTEVFSYIESELTAIEEVLPSRSEAEYGRVSQAAAYTLLAKLYP